MHAKFARLWRCPSPLNPSPALGRGELISHIVLLSREWEMGKARLEWGSSNAAGHVLFSAIPFANGHLPFVILHLSFSIENEK